jgi:hypothetical protein
MLRSIEHRIESLFEGVFGRAFRSHVQPVELARKLAKEMDDGKTASLSRVYVPNEYHLYLSPRDREQFRGYEQGLLTELADYLVEHARREGYVLMSRPRIELHEDHDLAVGEFGIATRLVQDGGEAARPPVPPPAPPVEPRVADAEPPAVSPPVEPHVSDAEPPAVAPPAGAPVPPAAVPPVAPVSATKIYGPGESAPPEDDDTPPPVVPPVQGTLVMAGVRHELDRPVVTLGRSKDCDIAIDDPSVSRRHAEVRRETGGFAVVDLGSTNGTRVNGAKVARAELEDGDRVTLGQTELRFERR